METIKLTDKSPLPYCGLKPRYLLFQSKTLTRSDPRSDIGLAMTDLEQKFPSISIVVFWGQHLPLKGGPFFVLEDQDVCVKLARTLASNVQT